MPQNCLLLFSSLPIINPLDFQQHVWNKEDESPPSLSSGGVEIERDPERNKIQTGMHILSERLEPPVHPLQACHDSGNHRVFRSRSTGTTYVAPTHQEHLHWKLHCCPTGPSFMSHLSSLRMITSDNSSTEKRCTCPGY